MSKLLETLEMIAEAITKNGREHQFERNEKMTHPEIERCERTGDNRRQPDGPALLICHQCGAERTIMREYDECIEKDFCDAACQVEFYQEEYDRLHRKLRRQEQERSRLALNYNTANESLKRANAEIRTIWDSARVAMIATGQGVVS